MGTPASRSIMPPALTDNRSSLTLESTILREYPFAMTSLVHSCHVWLRRSLPLSNSRQAWEERAGAIVSLAGMGLAWGSADRLPIWQRACLWVLLVLAVSIVL